MHTCSLSGVGQVECGDADPGCEQAQQQEEALESSSGLNMGQANTLDEMEAQVKAFPPMERALGKVGMTPREYSKFMLTMMMSAMVAGFQKSGVIKEIPPQLKEIHPDNVTACEMAAGSR